LAGGAGEGGGVKWCMGGGGKTRCPIRWPEMRKRMVEKKWKCQRKKRESGGGKRKEKKMQRSKEDLSGGPMPIPWEPGKEKGGAREEADPKEGAGTGGH